MKKKTKTPQMSFSLACLHESTTKRFPVVFDLFYENPEDSNLAGRAGASSSDGGSSLFVING